METKFKHFQELTSLELYDLLALRVAVFVLEQNCPYQDLDGKDQKSFHLIKRNEKGELIATARVLPAGISYEEVSIGRFVVAEAARKNGVGLAILKETMAFIRTEFGEVAVRISAQQHLTHFYAQVGFSPTGKKYLEDGIPHEEMIYKINN